MIATIAIASGKGGVGKSTVSTNLAVALAQRGAAVGLMDADVYGPNIPIMMGVRCAPRAADGRIEPLRAYGVKLMSIGFIVDADQALVWRGPMLHKTLRKLLTHVDWGGIEYLLVDLPPGTGDVPLTLAQSVSFAGAVIVTTPQTVALGDVRKGVAAFRRLEVPLVGIVENMSYYHCPKCGNEAHIFSRGGGRKAAEQYEVPFLGEIPLDITIREGGDSGTPIVAADPESVASTMFRQIAETIAERVETLKMQQRTDSLIQIQDP